MFALKKIAITSSIVAVALSLSACGFHLRGSTGATAMTYNTLSIIGDSKSNLPNQLADVMRGQVIQVTPPAPAQVTAEIGDIVHTKAVSSKNAAGRAIEYRLSTFATMQAYDANKKQLIAPVRLSISRTLSAGDGYDTGLDLEESRLYNDIDIELANQMQYRLRAIKLNGAP